LLQRLFARLLSIGHVQVIQESDCFLGEFELLGVLLIELCEGVAIKE
jgi:hypothetical protein